MTALVFLTNAIVQAGTDMYKINNKLDVTKLDVLNLCLLSLTLIQRI